MCVLRACVSACKRLLTKKAARRESRSIDCSIVSVCFSLAHCGSDRVFLLTFHRGIVLASNARNISTMGSMDRGRVRRNVKCLVVSRSQCVNNTNTIMRWRARIDRIRSVWCDMRMFIARQWEEQRSLYYSDSSSLRYIRTLGVKLQWADLDCGCSWRKKIQSSRMLIPDSRLD